MAGNKKKGIIQTKGKAGNPTNLPQKPRAERALAAGLPQKMPSKSIAPAGSSAMLPFTERLLQWHNEDNHRLMPWKGEKDPYKIWLSEIILQQTRVEQGLSYYEKFVRHYPSIAQLASAPEDQVFKDWEGLGYYSRCKNLIFTAKTIVKDYKGIFPDNYDQILSLKGIGPYTAAAISAFAFNKPYAVVDGNVFRVLSRFYGVDTPIDSTKGKQLFQKIAAENLSQTEPAIYNQAIMDFGATQCKPAAPLCGSCPMGDICQAKRTGRVMSLPKKEKTLQKKNRYISWIVMELQSADPVLKPNKVTPDNKAHLNKKADRHPPLYYIQKRPAGDIWENLHEFYPIETESVPEWSLKPSLLIRMLENLLSIAPSSGPLSIEAICTVTQQLTHQKIHGYIYKLCLTSRPSIFPINNWYSAKKVNDLAFPKLLKNLQIEAIPKQK